MPKTNKTIPLVAFFLFWIILQALSILSEAKLPSTDVFLFKEAGVNLALHGKLAAKNLPHMPSDQQLVFSYYPPVFPFSFGVWTRLVGVGLRQSQSFDALLRILRTLLMGLFFLPWFRTHKQKMWFAMACLFFVSFISSDGDRPDELAMVWGWGAWLIAQEVSSWKGVGVAGVLLGLCAGTSPAAGVFFVLGASAVYLANGLRPRWLIGISAMVAGVVFCLCNLPIYLSDPHAYSRFSEQVPLSTFPYLEPLKKGLGLDQAIGDFLAYLKHQFIVAGPYLFLVAVLLIALLGYVIRHRRQISRQWFAIFGASFLYLFLCVFVWTLQPNYLWFSGLSFVGLFASLPLKRSRVSYYVATGVIFLALTPLLAREFKVYSAALQRKEGDRWESVRDEVLPIVGQDSKFAITPDQYFTFRGEREVDNVIYVCDRLDEYDFVYITRYNASRMSEPDPFRIPCGNTACFTVLRDFSSLHPYQLFGKNTSYVVKGSGGVLYHNTACPHPIRALSMNR